MAVDTDEFGTEFGYCNACGEETAIGTECCEDGEVVEYDDDQDGAPSADEPEEPGTTDAPTDSVPVGQRIRDARMARNLTQVELAEKIGESVSVSVVKQWERRETLPSRNSMYTEAFEKALDIVLDETAVRHRPFDPPVSQAPDALLIAELSRRLGTATPTTTREGAK